MGKSISIVGVGMGNPDLLTKEARCALLDAELIIGSKRLKDAMPKNCQAPFHETSDGKEMLHIIEDTEWENIVVCMSGDSGFYSGTKGLISYLEKKYEVKVLPGISSISYLAAKCGISWQDACIVSLHGRCENWIQAVKSHEKTFVLMGNSSDLRTIVEKLCLAGLKECKLLIGIRLSYADEKIITAKAGTLLDRGDKLDSISDPLSAMFILNDNPGHASASFGISDEEFLKGQVPMPKQEVRAVTMSRLNLLENSIAYDIGAGMGALSVEMSAHAWKGSIYAIENNAKALELLHANKERFMADNLEIKEGKLAEVLNNLPAPDAVFIGGLKTDMGKAIELVLEKNPKVRIVMNIMSLEMLADVISLVRKYSLQNLEISQVSGARGREVGGQMLLEGLNPVFVVSVTGE